MLLRFNVSSKVFIVYTAHTTVLMTRERHLYLISWYRVLGFAHFQIFRELLFSHTLKLLKIIVAVFHFDISGYNVENGISTLVHLVYKHLLSCVILLELMKHLSLMWLQLKDRLLTIEFCTIKLRYHKH
jgi:hypothetical protein